MVNFGLNDKTSHLKYIEYGGRPLGSFNSKYVDEVEGNCSNWIEKEDMLCDTEEQLDEAIHVLSDMYQEHVRLCRLSTC